MRHVSRYAAREWGMAARAPDRARDARSGVMLLLVTGFRRDAPLARRTPRPTGRPRPLRATRRPVFALL